MTHEKNPEAGAPGSSRLCANWRGGGVEAQLAQDGAQPGWDAESWVGGKK
jgi:hypothetical protein